MAASRSIRRHHRQRVIRKRMRFADEVWRVYQPGVKYGPLDEPRTTTYPSWFVPGRFAKIHPARVCSCEFCHPERAPGRRAAEERRWRRDHETDTKGEA